MSVPGMTRVNQGRPARSAYSLLVQPKPVYSKYSPENTGVFVVDHGDKPWSVTAHTAPVNIAAMKKQLQNPNPAKRLAAVRALQKSKNKNAVLPIIKHITDPHEGVRKAAWRAMQTLYKMPAIKKYVDSNVALFRLGIQNKDAAIRRAYVYAMGIVKDKGSVPALCTMVRSEKNLYVAGAAAWALAAIGARDRAAIVTIGSRMHTALARLYIKGNDKKATDDLLAALGRALIGLGQANILRIFLNKLLNDLSSAHPLTRRRATRGLVSLLLSKPIRVAYGMSRMHILGQKLLKRLTYETLYGTKSVTVVALQLVKHHAAVQVLSKMLTSGIRDFEGLSSSGKNNAALFMFQLAQALGGIGGRKAIPVLKRIQYTPTKGSRWEKYRLLGTVYALSAMKDRSVIPYLLKSLNDPDWQIRGLAVHAAGKLRDVKFIKPLVGRLAVEGDSRIEKDVYRALYQISKKKALSTAHRQLINRAFALYRDGKRNSKNRTGNNKKLSKLAK